MPPASKNTLNESIASVFEQKAQRLNEKGEKHRFRALSYVRAAQAVRNLEEGLDEIYRRSWLTGLQKIKGIGNRIAHDIEHELKKRGVSR